MALARMAPTHHPTTHVQSCDHFVAVVTLLAQSMLGVLPLQGSQPAHVPGRGANAHPQLQDHPDLGPLHLGAGLQKSSSTQCVVLESKPSPDLLTLVHQHTLQTKQHASPSNHKVLSNWLESIIRGIDLKLLHFLTSYRRPLELPLT